MQPICIMAALENELREVLSQISIERIERFGMTKFYLGNFKGKAVVVVETNWGVVPATMAAMTAVMHYQPAAILVTGISGALAPGMGKGDIVIVDATYNHNFEMVAPNGRYALPLPYHDRLGRYQALRRIASDKHLVQLATQAAREMGLQPDLGQPRLWVGASVAGEAMTFERQERTRLATAYGAVAVDMETIGQAHVALTFAIPYLAVRQISDAIFDEMIYEESRFPALLDQNALVYTAEELRQISESPTWQSQPAAVFDKQTSWATTAAKIVLKVVEHFAESKDESAIS